MARFPAALGSLASDLDKYRKRRRLPRTIRASSLFRPDVRVRPVPHHRAHAASAYLASPFDDALVVTLDGRGEYETACVYDGCRGRLHLRHRIVYPHSFGYLYSMLTRYLGFRPQRDEYKVMGLAAYGTPSLVSRVAQLARLARLDNVTGRLWLDLRYFDHHRRPSADRNLRNIAYAAQHLLEELVAAFLTHAQRLVPRRDLCLAGGVALN